MQKKFPIDSLSVIARQCVAVTCLERFCRQYDINHPAISAFIEHVWQVAHVAPATFGEWEKGFSLLSASGFGDLWPDEVRSAISEESLNTLVELVEHVVETSASAWYGDDLPATRHHLEFVLKICEEHGVTAPDLRNYLQSRPQMYGGWGPPLTDEELAAWRTLS
jgi:hypothetical protein